MPELETMPDLNDAIARLDAAEAAETPPPEPGQVKQAEQEPQQPVVPQTDGKETPNEISTAGTPAAAEPKPTGQQSETTPKAGDKNKSAFAKDQERRDTSWKALNVAKDALQKEQDAFKAQQELHQREVTQFKQKSAKQAYTPEQYEQASAQKLLLSQRLDLEAEGLEARAEKLEADAKYGEAENLRVQAKDRRETAAAQRGLARQMKETAAEVRQNPDPTAQQVQAQQAQRMRDYTLKAAQQWPDLAKDGSQFQKDVAAHLKAAAEQGIDPNEHPIMMYHAARLTAAETAAARVPVMEKELGEMRAKVKELEALTAPGGGSPSATKFPKERPLTDEEEGQELRQLALQR